MQPHPSTIRKRLTPYNPPSVEEKKEDGRTLFQGINWPVVAVVFFLVLLNVTETPLLSIVPNLRCDSCASSLVRVKEGLSTAVTAAVGASQFGQSSSMLGPTFDILSIGSLAQPELLEAQRRTFGSHVSVRYFVNATEQDDADRNCHSHDPFETVKWCKSRAYSNQRQKFRRRLSEGYARVPWLAKKKNPVGMMCAQQRPSLAFHNLVRTKYQNNTTSLPDYLLVGDDDTYFNVELIGRYLEKEDPDVPKALAGCMVRDFLAQYTFPIGGFGLILSRGKPTNDLLR